MARERSAGHTLRGGHSPPTPLTTDHAGAHTGPVPAVVAFWWPWWLRYQDEGLCGKAAHQNSAWV